MFFYLQTTRVANFLRYFWGIFIDNNISGQLVQVGQPLHTLLFVVAVEPFVTDHDPVGFVQHLHMVSGEAHPDMAGSVPGAGRILMCPALQGEASVGISGYGGVMGHVKWHTG